MEFPFYVSKVMPIDADGFAILDANSCSRNGVTNTTSYMRSNSYAKMDNSGSLAQIIDKMGEASSFAQGLRSIITNYAKFVSSGDNRLYIKVQDNKVCGILKVGKRNLFHHDGITKVKELRPLCVLDFYVHESMQRNGVGKILFEKMLETENVEPRKLAYDRPSPKFIGFLKKHYGLSHFVPQNNNFVIFTQYWEEPRSKPSLTQLNSRNTLPEEKKNIPSSTQTEFHKVGRSILESNNLTSYMKNDVNKNNMVGYSQPQYNTFYNPGHQQNAMINSSRRSVADITPPVGTVGAGRESLPSSKNESRLKYTEEAITNTKEKPVEQITENKKNPYMILTDKGYKEYQTRTPWGNIGSNVDAFKTSYNYGSYYNPGSRGYGRK